MDQTFEIALDIDPADEKDLVALRDHGWHVVDPRVVASGPAAFRAYVQASGAEFSVAQGVYVETQSGWFSDRTVRYLASGRPALVQDTGFSRNYPVGEGLLAFRTMEEAAAGAERIARDYAEHCAPPARSPRLISIRIGSWAGCSRRRVLSPEPIYGSDKGSPIILLSGMIAAVPDQGGATWAVLQYLLGFRRLGYRVVFVESIPAASLSPPGVPLDRTRNAGYFRRVMEDFGFVSDSALLVAGTRQTVGLPYEELRRVARSADLLINISGMLADEGLVGDIPRRVYLDLDPAFNQLWHASRACEMRFLAHTHFVTIGLAIGRSDCPVPTCGVRWITTPQPVVLSAWPVAREIAHAALTTVGHWRSYGSIEHDGVLYGQKAHSLRRFITLPTLTDERFLMALAIHPDERNDLAALAANGWQLIDPAQVARTPAGYRQFIRTSRAEFGIAKSGYVRSRCGWVSDRSLCYLASGRPVLRKRPDSATSSRPAKGCSRSNPPRISSPPSRISGRTTPATRVRHGISPKSHSIPIRSSVASWTASARPEVVPGMIDPLGSAFFYRRGREMTVDGTLPGPTAGADQAAPNYELRPVLDDLLHHHDPSLGRIVRLESRPCVDRTSFHLIDLELKLEGGLDLRLLLKDLGMKNLHESARWVKPRFLYDPLREIRTYQEILARDRLGTAHFYGAVVKPDEDIYWLFLEKVPGVRLNQSRVASAWLQAARWLASLHCRPSEESERLSRSVPLLRYNAAFYRLWLDRVEIFRSMGLSRAVWESLVDTYGRAIQRLIRLPSTLIHGEFYASNILVQETREGCRIRPVDWEMAAVGPGLIDLAALSSGAWAERERTEMAAAYHDAVLAQGWPSFPFENLLLSLDDCRLHLAIRWLGWAPDWSPPPENAHDWLGEAIALCDKMRAR